MADAAAQNQLEMRFLIQWLVATNDQVHKSMGMAMVEATELAYADAVNRVKAQFNNTPGRVRTGGLANAISRGFDVKKGTGFLRVQSPYGAAMEFGETVHPVNAKNLWIKNWVGVPSDVRRMTPREWMAAHKSKATAARFPFIGRTAAVMVGPNRAVTMFALANEATIPARPYIRPAVAMAFARLPALLQARMAGG